VRPLRKAIAIAALQVLIVCSLGAKLLYDRHTRPQAWFRSERYDPDLPIRGRYLSLQLEVADPRSPAELQQKFGNEIQMQERWQAKSVVHWYQFGNECGSIVLQNGSPSAEFSGESTFPCENLTFSRWHRGDTTTLRVAEPVLFFISDTAKDPTHLDRGDELWVLATIPRKGPPRPIALGIKKAGENTIRQLALN
jgi:hypothetical protein